MIRLIYEMLKGINKNIDKNEQLKEKDRKNALEEEMDMYGLDEDDYYKDDLDYDDDDDEY